MNDMKVKYIDNDITKGLKYDWKAIKKQLEKLDIPPDYYSPVTCPLDLNQWFEMLSERAVGKTTGFLLLGLIMYNMYETVTIYTRSTKEQITPKNTNSLFSVILDNKYIEKITDGVYNSVYYNSRKWYLCYADDSGIVSIDSKYFCRMVSIDEAGNLKSSFNEPRGDLILFDEFIPINPRLCRMNEFVEFVDLISTIFRMRESGKIIMLANVIDKYNQYFHDLEIFETISEMQTGDKTSFRTDRGTKIYIEIIGTPQTYKKKKRKWVKLFAGFGKKELSAITGEATWSVKNYQHIPIEEREENTSEILFNKVYISHNSKMLRLDIVNNVSLGICIYCHWASKTYNDSIILSKDNINDSRIIYGIGTTDMNIYKFILNMLKKHKIYFASNDCGCLFEKYMNVCGINPTLYL